MTYEPLFDMEYEIGPINYEPSLDFVDIVQGYRDGYLSLKDVNGYVDLMNQENEAYIAYADHVMSEIDNTRNGS